MKMQDTATTMVLATHNRGKMREFRFLLEPHGWQVLGLDDIGIKKDVAETGASFGDNARLKAVAYSLNTDLPVLADDSGLEVLALAGRPGIQSARYAGPHASDSDRMLKLLLELKQSGGARTARFVCALALAQSGAVVLETEGECRGEIACEPKGNNGFGFDPIFFIPELGRTYAQLDEEEKNRCSHRARAVAALLAGLQSHAEKRCLSPDFQLE
ncbi:MAG: RdgB/HAM1 family non-canonical purine NTP pyrophosphatase [Acidobacteriota bacterium]|jgi:XTP/dITP diphosphohydrolase